MAAEKCMFLDPATAAYVHTKKDGLTETDLQIIQLMESDRLEQTQREQVNSYIKS